MKKIINISGNLRLLFFPLYWGAEFLSRMNYSLSSLKVGNRWGIKGCNIVTAIINIGGATAFFVQILYVV